MAQALSDTFSLSCRLELKREPIWHVLRFAVPWPLAPRGHFAFCQLFLVLLKIFLSKLHAVGAPFEMYQSAIGDPGHEEVEFL